MNSFPPAIPQFPATAPVRPLGAITLTSDLESAATSLRDRLTSGGCTQVAFDECSSFQQAYNNAGGALVLDGKYGAATKDALQSVLTTVDGSTAPASCFGDGSSSRSTSTAIVPATSAPSLATFFAPGATVNLPIVGAVQTRTLLMGAVGLFAIWLVGSALYRTYAEGPVGVHHPVRRKRRKNPARRRRVREKARARAKVQTRDPKTGRFKR